MGHGASRAAAVLALALTTSCAWHQRPKAARTDVKDCVTVDVAPLESEETPEGGVMLQLSLKNACEERIGVDVRALRVTLDGHPAKPFDPRHELRAAHLGELAQARERIIYLGRRDDAADRLCVTVSTMVSGIDDRGERCFVRGETGWSPP